MKLLLMIHGLGAGGAERVMTLLADGLAARGHEVSLLTLSGSGEDFFAPGSGVDRVRLDLGGESLTMVHGLWANLRRIGTLRRKIRGLAPDAVISFATTVNILALIACSGTRVPVVISERVDPRADPLPCRWRLLRYLAYRRARALVVQTAPISDWYRRWLPARVLISKIANPVAVEMPSEPAKLPVRKPFILAAGRLVHQKGFDLLLQAFSLTASQLSSLNLVIAGEGPEAASLEALARGYGVESRVFFLGRVSPLSALMREAHAFVLSSRYEGFPNVLVEALAIGVPVVATDCPSGPREILSDGHYGILVPPENARELSMALLRVASDVALHKQLSASGPSAVARYRLDAIVAEWEQLVSGHRKG